MYSQNKNISEALQQLDELPGGIHLDSAATWNKIEDRLRPNKKNKLAWLRFAAVFLLLTCGIIAYMLQGASSTKSSTGIAVANDPDIQKPRQIVAKTEEHVNVEKPVTTKQTRLKQKPLLVTAHTPLVEDNPATVIASPVINTPVTETGISPITVNQNAIVNTAPLVTTAKKPRLRVVHLDDLYKPDPVEIAKAETKKQQGAEEVGETEPANVTPSRPFWKSKVPIRIAISLTDNQ